MDLTSVGSVTNCVKLFVFDCMICGNSLPASFRSDCVLKYELSNLAFSLSSVYIISFSFRGGVMLYLGLIKTILESSTNLYCFSCGWKLVYLLDCQSRFSWRIEIV